MGAGSITGPRRSSGRRVVPRGHHGRPLRVAAETQRRRQRQRQSDSRAWGRARSHRRVSVRGAGLPALPSVLRMIRIAILGSTGSIGESALSVVEAHPDRVSVVALAAGHNTTRLAEQVRKFRPALVSVATDQGLAELTAQLSLSPGGGERPATDVGANGLIAAATHPDVDLVLCASSGAAGLEAAFAAIELGKTVALANKEVLVMAGGLMVGEARKRGVSLLPVDSEHNAIHQCLHGRAPDEVRRLVLTASGGPFRDWTTDALARVTPADALRHPTWQMGKKITID